MRVHYNPDLKQKSRRLRKNSTLAEVLLWNQLRSRKLRGHKFLRQKPIGEYIVDFFCNELRLVIEIDGESHVGRECQDQVRAEYLESLGLTILRFNDLDVKTNMEGVSQRLEEYVSEKEKALRY